MRFYGIGQSLDRRSCIEALIRFLQWEPPLLRRLLKLQTGSGRVAGVCNPLLGEENPKSQRANKPQVITAIELVHGSVGGMAQWTSSVPMTRCLWRCTREGPDRMGT